MKLKEYFAAIAHVLHEHETEGQVLNAVLECKEGQGKVLNEFQRAIAAVRESLLNNKNLLGIFDPPQAKEEMMEKEITEKNMRRHLLKVRRDLVKHKPKNCEDKSQLTQFTEFEWIMVRMLTDITRVCGNGFPELGGVFSRMEEKAFTAEFREETTHTTPPQPPVEDNPLRSAFPAHQPSSGASPELEKLTEEAIKARSKSYQEQTAAIEALNAQLRKEGKIL